MTQTPTLDIDQLLQESIHFRAHNRSANTLKNYAFDWKTFRAWCERFGRESLPASTETVLLYITDTLRRHRVSTGQRRFSAINFHHAQAGLEPPAGREVRALLTGAQRLRCEKPTPKRSLTVEELRQICAITFEREDLFGVRDHAVLTFGFASALRRSNLTALQLDDIEYVAEGLVVHIAKAKNDQLAKGRYLGIAYGQHTQTCAVRAVKKWIEQRGDKPGPLFNPLKWNRRLFKGYIFTETRHKAPLTGEGFCQIVHRAVRSIGLDPALYGAHSLRSGFVTAAGQAGLNTLTIAAQTGHRSLDSLKHYFHSSDLFKSNPSGMIGL